MGTLACVHGFVLICLSPSHCFILSKSFVLFKLFIITDLACWASILFAHARTCLHVTSLLSPFLFLPVYHCLLSMHCSFNCLFSFYLHSTAASLGQPIHFSAFSFSCLTDLQNCYDLTVSLYCGLNLSSNDVDKPCNVLHLSCSVWVSVSRNCGPFLPSKCFIIAIFSVCGILCDFNILFISDLKFLSSFYLSSAS